MCHFSWQTKQARKLVLVVDNSASMNATDIRPTRLDQARKLAGGSARMESDVAKRT